MTGGLGYIGSHTVVELMGAGYAVTIVDNLSNAHRGALARIRSMVARPDELAFVELDIRDRAALEKLFVDAAAAASASSCTRRTIILSLAAPIKTAAGTPRCSA